MTGSAATSLPAPPGQVPVAPSSVGPLDLYRVVAHEAVRAAARWSLAPILAGVLVVAYFVLRTLDLDPLILRLWLVSAAVLAFVNPAGGLLVLAAIAPFNEGVLVSRDLGSKTVLAAVLAVSTSARWAIAQVGRDRVIRASVPVILAIGLLVATGLSLIRTWDRWGADFALGAAQIWGQGVATMLLVFVASVWVGRGGIRGPIFVTLAATTVAGLISLADFVGDATIRETALAWLVAGPFSPTRLTGVIRSPTSTAALVMIPLSFYLVVVGIGRDRLARVGAALLSVPLLIAAYLTYNRAVFLALIVWLVVVGWRIRRGLGIALFALAVAGSAVLVPWYISVRGAAVGSGSQVQPGEILIASDQQRITAWTAASRMFLDEPILGQGYRAYRQLSVEFGDTTLNAPHNEWLRLFAEDGVVAGLLGLGFAAATAISLARRPGALETGILVAFLATCLAASFNNPFLFNQVTIPAFVLAGCGVALAGRRPSMEGA